MQTTRAASALVLALLAVGASAARKSSSSASLSQAREWLRSHGPAPPQDELQELKGANPEAYAIVKALLTKRALGLLDPRHPTASFAPGQTAAAAPPMSSVDFAASVGVKAEASSGAASEASDDAVEVAPPPVHHSHKDWLNWRPADSAAEDDAQVQQVLGTVSQLRAGGVASSAAGASDAPAPPEPPVAQLATAQPSAAQPAAATEQTNSYLKGIDLGAPALRDTAAAPKAQDNSYLKGLDLGSPGRTAPEPALAAKQQGLVGVRQAVSQDSGGGDYLKDFSWSDGDAAASRPDVDAHPLPPARIVSQDEALPAARVLTSFGGQLEAASAPAQTTPAPPRKQNALVSWLGSSWGPVQAKPTAERTAASSSGPSARRGAGHYSQYLKDLTGSS